MRSMSWLRPFPRPVFANSRAELRASAGWARVWARGFVRVTAALMLAALTLTGCAAGGASDHDALAPVLARLPASGLVLMGEQHDAPDHQRLQRALAQALSAQGRLGGVVLEMADAGRHTQGLAANATEAQVRDALAWSDDAWPWNAYGPGVMAAVRAGVVVWGGNLPRAELRQTMTQADGDARLTAEEWKEQEARMDSGHCGLLPASQWRPMARVQTARDVRMATVAQGLVRPGQLVLVWTGSEHADRRLGIPRFAGNTPVLSVRMVAGKASAGQPDSTAALGAADARHDVLITTPAIAPRDHCAELRASMRRPAP